MSDLSSACDAFRKAALDLLAFEAENQVVVQRLRTLEAEKKAAMEAVKDLGAGLSPNSSMVVSGVDVRRTVSTTVDPDLLAKVPAAVAIDGLFKRVVDLKVLTGAMNAGLIDKSEVEACRTLVKAEIVKATVLDG